MNNFPAELEFLKHDLSNLHIMVVGDVMLDRYILGSTTRISPEAPVPIVNCSKTEDKLGGAANVIANLKSMGCTTSLLSVCGEDDEARIIKNLLEDIKCNHVFILTDPSRRTTLKTRIIADQSHLVRIDYENISDISVELQNKCLQILIDQINRKKPDVIILQDYNKGVLNAGWISKIIDLAHSKGVKIAVDPKKNNFFEYKGVEIFKPNLKEALEAENWPGDKPVKLEVLSNSLKNKLLCETILITLAADGIWIDNKKAKEKYPTRSRNIIDVSGAGDSVISLAAICLAYSLTDKSLALCCNAAGGLVCEKSGVVPIAKEALIKELED